MVRNMKIRYVALRGGHHTSKICANSIGAEHINIWAPLRNIVFIFTFRTQLAMAVFFCILQLFLTKKHNGAVYLTEGIVPVIFPMFMRFFKNEKNIIIMRGNDTSFQSGTRHCMPLYRLLYNQLDGIVAISELIAEDAKKYVSCPIQVSHTPLWRNYSELSTNIPDFNEQNFIFIGEYRPHKGVDIIAKVMKKILPITKSKIYMVGSGIKENLEKEGLLDPRFICVGETNPIGYIKKAQFHIHPARYEAGPGTTTECMAAGLLSFVSFMTGNKDLVRQVSEELILKTLNPTEISEHILTFLKNKSINELKQLSYKAKEIAKENDSENGAKKFKTAFYKVIDEINARPAQ